MATDLLIFSDVAATVSGDFCKVISSSNISLLFSSVAKQSGALFRSSPISTITTEGASGVRWMIHGDWGSVCRAYDLLETALRLCQIELAEKTGAIIESFNARVGEPHCRSVARCQDNGGLGSESMSENVQSIEQEKNLCNGLKMGPNQTAQISASGHQSRNSFMMHSMTCKDGLPVSGRAEPRVSIEDFSDSFNGIINQEDFVASSRETIVCGGNLNKTNLDNEHLTEVANGYDKLNQSWLQQPDSRVNFIPCQDQFPQNFGRVEYNQRICNASADSVGFDEYGLSHTNSSQVFDAGYWESNHVPNGRDLIPYVENSPWVSRGNGMYNNASASWMSWEDYRHNQSLDSESTNVLNSQSVNKFKYYHNAVNGLKMTGSLDSAKVMNHDKDGLCVRDYELDDDTDVGRQVASCHPHASGHASSLPTDAAGMERSTRCLESTSHQAILCYDKESAGYNGDHVLAQYNHDQVYFTYNERGGDFIDQGSNFRKISPLEMNRADTEKGPMMLSYQSRNYQSSISSDQILYDAFPESQKQHLQESQLGVISGLHRSVYQQSETAHCLPVSKLQGSGHTNELSNLYYAGHDVASPMPIEENVSDRMRNTVAIRQEYSALPVSTVQQCPELSGVLQTFERSNFSFTTQGKNSEEDQSTGWFDADDVDDSDLPYANDIRTSAVECSVDSLPCENSYVFAQNSLMVNNNMRSLGEISESSVVHQESLHTDSFCTSKGDKSAVQNHFETAFEAVSLPEDGSINGMHRSNNMQSIKSQANDSPKSSIICPSSHVDQPYLVSGHLNDIVETSVNSGNGDALSHSRECGDASLPERCRSPSPTVRDVKHTASGQISSISKQIKIIPKKRKLDVVDDESCTTVYRERKIRDADKQSSKTGLKNRVESCVSNEDGIHVRKCKAQEMSVDGKLRQLNEAPDADITSTDAISDLTCSVCRRQFSTSSNLLRHVRTSHEQLRHECSSCSKRFTCRASLQRHTLIVHENLRCDSCRSIFDDESLLRSHKCEVVGQPACETCGRNFSNVSNLNKHRRMAHSFSCVDCVRIFVSKADMREHECTSRNSTTEPPCVSPETNSCSNPVLRRSAVTKRKRNTVRSWRSKSCAVFSCTKCARKFSTSSNLRKHERMVHERVRYICAECSKRYASREELRRHEARKHRGLSFRCVLCKIECTTRRQLRRHGWQVHRHLTVFDGWQCEQCGKTFLHQRNLARHRKLLHVVKSPLTS